MTTTTAPHTSLDRFFDTLRRSPIRRATTDRSIAGVCAAVAAHLGISTKITRIGAVVLALLGIGVPAYLIAWLLLPDTADKLHVERALRQGSTGSIVLLVLAALSILPDPHPLSGFWTVVLIAGAVFAFLAFTRTVTGPVASAGSTSPVAPPPAPAGTPQDAQRW